MKRRISVLLAVAVVAVGFLAGCGNKVDETRTPAQIRQEIANWSSARIQKSIDAYNQEIAKRTAELKAELVKLKQLPVRELLGDAGKQLKIKADRLVESLCKLKDNLAVYASELKAKAEARVKAAK